MLLNCSFRCAEFASVIPSQELISVIKFLYQNLRVSVIQEKMLEPVLNKNIVVESGLGSETVVLRCA